MRNALLLTAFLLGSTCLAGGDPLPVGARFLGMGGSGLTLADPWSVRLNPAGIAGLEAPVAGLFYQRHFLSEDLAHQGLAVALPVGKGAFGVGADRFGYDLYNETRASLAYAMRFGEGLRAAVQMNYLGVRLGGNYGSTAAFAAELGVQAKISEQFWLGAHLFNPTRAKLGAVTESNVALDERVPTLLRAGLGWVANSKLTITGEVEKDIDRAERFRFGLEYNPSKVLFIRTGISTAPVQAHFGVGLRAGKLDVDLAMAFRSQLGPTPMINLNYRFS
ncbi:MAG TPA: hypothetical protein PKY96_00775 [Flavobacteriales bacterium]|nr:hypothetical protein [Flavobacteriales bacterium]